MLVKSAKAPSIYDEIKKELLADSELELKELKKEALELSKSIEKQEEELRKDLSLKDQSASDISQINSALRSMNKKDFSFSLEIGKQLNRLTGSKKLVTNHKIASTKVDKAKIANKLFQHYTARQLKNDLTLLDAWKLIGSKTASEIKVLMEEFNNLEAKWQKWFELKKLIKEKREKQLIVNSLDGKSEAIMKTLKEHLKNYEKAHSKTGEKTNILREIKNMKLFENVKSKQMNQFLKSLVKEFKIHELDAIKSRLEWLKDTASKIYEELADCFKDFPSLIEIRNLQKSSRNARKIVNTKTKIFDISLSPEESKGWEKAPIIALEFKNLREANYVQKVNNVFKTLKGKTPEEVVKEFKRIGSFKAEADICKSVVKAIEKRLDKNNLNKPILEALQAELNERQKEEKRKEEQVQLAYKVEEDLKSKSVQELTKEIQELEKLRDLIIEGSDSNVKVAPEALKKWQEIQQRAIIKVGDNWKKSSNLKPSGRNSMGVKGISLDDDDKIISVSSTHEGNMVLTIDEEGNGKCTSLEKFRLTGRNTKGVLSCLNQAAYERRKKAKAVKEDNKKTKGDKTAGKKTSKDVGSTPKSPQDKYFKKLIACTLINNKEDVITLLTEQGFFTRFKSSEEIVSVKSGRVTSGAKLIELGNKDKIKCFAKFKSLDEEHWKTNKTEEGE